MFRGEQAVQRFLAAEPALTPLLLEAETEIHRVFGPQITLTLDMTFDPDNGMDCGELFALIGTSEAAAAALEKLDRLDETWWRAASRRAQGKMNIDVEFL